METQVYIFDNLIRKIMNPYNVILSLTFTFFLTLTAKLSNTSLFGVSLLFVAVVCLFMVVDWFLGVTSSVCIQGQKFKSKKVTYTVIKFVTFFMWLFFVNQARFAYKDVAYISDIIILIQIFVLILIALREYSSIGENIEQIWGRKPYWFSLIDSITDTLEKSFKNRLKDKIDKE